MNILVLHSELGVLRGGGENFTRNLFSAFAERGHCVTAAFVANHNGRYALPLPPIIQPIPIRGWWSSSLGQATLSAVGRYFPPEGRYRKEWDRIQGAISWRVFRWHKQRFQRRIETTFSKKWEDFDAVYVHGDTALASMVARYRPTVLRLPGPVTAELEPVLRKVHAVCANGDALARIRGFLGNHASELPVGISSELFKPGLTSVRSRLGWNLRDKVLGYVGRLSHLKGVDLLVSAFRELSVTVPDARLLIVGQGELRNSICSVIANDLARGRAHIEGDVDHVKLSEWYRAMDLLVMPSRYENFSNAILEAMACGVPFLASDIGGNRSLADTGSGWLFEAGSISSLVLSLRRILEDQAEMKACGEIGCRYVHGRYNWARTAELFEQLMVSCLETKK
jgi:glycosyltransferase involved in cell wall biosynthesis